MITRIKNRHIAFGHCLNDTKIPANRKNPVACTKKSGHEVPIDSPFFGKKLSARDCVRALPFCHGHGLHHARRGPHHGRDHALHESPHIP